MNNTSMVLEKDAALTGLTYSFFKRFIDLLISSIALIILAPLFLIITLIIKITDGGNAIFTQNRIGLNGKEFKIYKFRTMINNADKVLEELMAKDEKIRKEYEINKKLKNDPRITKIGKFLRKSSLDELPQLFNVFLGDMSIVGNRPYLPKEKHDMNGYYVDIIKTKPGITGLWQVSGRSNTTFKTRCKLEADYSKKVSFKLDLKIFLKTFAVVFKGL